MNNQSSDNERIKKPASNVGFSSAFALGWEMGYTIAIPLVIFALMGRLADKYLGTSPLFLLGGIIFSIVVSIALLYKKINKILKSD